MRRERKRANESREKSRPRGQELSKDRVWPKWLVYIGKLAEVKSSPWDGEVYNRGWDEKCWKEP